MSSFNLKAEKREKFGSLEANRIKKSGNIPAVILAKSGNKNITVNAREFDIEYRKGNIQSRVIEIEVDGKKVKSIVRNIDLDPVKDKIVHLEFLDLEDTKQVRAWPKVEITGRDRSPGIKRGGFLNVRLRKVEVVCEDIAKIPSIIEIDVSKLRVGDKVRKDDINPGTGVKFATNRNFLFLSITGRGKSATEEAAAPAEGGEEAAEGSSEGAEAAAS